ncbi:MAG: sensor histidine kinase [Chloroflexota bacterium]|nr:sensor histidine kinase [Dehalococcoidia bacterium]MDW8254453.1 sensor histidine kinase [Chloroflexota bacterium]
MNPLFRWLRRLALEQTARYLERHEHLVLQEWHRLLADAQLHTPRRDAESIVARGRDNLRLLVAALRAETPEEESQVASEASRWGAERALWGIEHELELSDLLQPLSLFRAAVQSTVQRMLARRLWLAVPSDVLAAVARINAAIDLQLFAISEEYLKARDRIIRSNEEALERSNRQLLLLNQEMQHRVRNNLQTIADLLSLEIANGITKPPAESLRESLARVRCIAAVHDLLTPDAGESNNMGELATRVAAIAVRALAGDQPIDISVRGEAWPLPTKAATSLALVLNELISNSIEHGLRGQPEGRIEVVFATVEGMGEMRVIDNGVGLPPGFSLDEGQNLGLRIARALIADDLKGTLELHSNGGTVATIRFPLPIAHPAEKNCPRSERTGD